MAESSHPGSPVSAYWHAYTALAAAGFELPSEMPEDQGDASDFELLFDAGAGLELALRFVSDLSAFDVEARLPQAGTATLQAGLLLARTVDDLKCSVHLQTEQFCVTRRTMWSLDSSAEDLAVLIAETVVLGHDLTQARTPPSLSARDASEAAVIRV